MYILFHQFTKQPLLCHILSSGPYPEILKGGADFGGRTKQEVWGTATMQPPDAEGYFHFCMAVLAYKLAHINFKYPSHAE